MSSLLARAPRFTLASLLTSYPAADFALRLEALLTALDGDALLGPELVAALGRLSTAGELEALRSDYIAWFERAGTPLRSTGYARMLGPGIGVALAEVAAFYSAFGFHCCEETADHLAVGLEFYALCLVKEAYLDEAGDLEGVAVVAAAGRRFFADALGPLLLAVARDSADHPRFAAVAGYLGRLAADEAERLELTLVPLALPSEDLKIWQSDQGEVTCGGEELTATSNLHPLGGEPK